MAIVNLFQRMGGEGGLRRLVDVFYDYMDALPEAREIRELHPPDLGSSREKLYMFLSGWSGGPPLFVQKHGHPRLRMRHLPFAIGTRERDQWLFCMSKAIEECISDPEVKTLLREKFTHIADFMRNQEG